MKTGFYAGALVAVFATGLSVGFASTLEEDFRTPPPGTGPYAWWHWLGYNVSSNGITRDLAAMKAAGVSGATIFTLASHAGRWEGQPMTNQFCRGMSYGNDVWWAHVRFAVEEAQRLGLKVGVHNCSGFSVSGGTWIDPAHAMKQLVWTKAPKGTKPPAPRATLGFYRDLGEVTVGDVTYRFGYSAMNRHPRPSPEDMEDKALECDKMNAASVKLHIDNVLPEIRRRLGDSVGGSLEHVMMDSYESGDPTWTDDFREQFVASRGYDPLPYLPVFAGAKVADEKRFREDFADLVKELFTRCHYEQLHERIAAEGLEFHLEPYDGPIDNWEAARCADIPMVEFWGLTSWSKPDVFGGYPVYAGAVGRAMGRRVIGSEAFTLYPTSARWTESPRDFKDSGDASFARGINRLYLHHWAHQPFDPKWMPGNTMGFWGTHFGECNTWFEPGKAWYRYLGRCQALLQRGEQVVDRLSYKGKPKASEFDAVPDSTFLRDLDVAADGRLRLPSGRTYALLQMPGGAVSRPVARKLRELVRKGAAVWAPERLTRARGLADGQAADAEVREIAKEIWDMPHPRVFTKGTPEEALAKLGLPADFDVLGGQADANRPVLACHRTDGAADWYFVCNTSTNAVTRRLAFRVTGRVPELWDPERVTVADAAGWAEEGGRTFVEYAFAPLESRFFVFRRAGRPQAAAVRKPETFVGAALLSGNWFVRFQPGRGAPAGELVFDGLQSLSESDIPGVRFFSGTATYKTLLEFQNSRPYPCADGSRVRDFQARSKRLVLNLGDVREIAKVRIDGKEVATLWHPPYAVDVSAFITRADKVYTIEVEVTNTWFNRLAGDEREPDDCEYAVPNPKAGFNIGRGLRCLPDYLFTNAERPSKNRVGFCVWNYFGANTKPIPSGLIGPVTLEGYEPK